MPVFHRRALAALALLIYLVLALYLSRILMASDDEESYLGLGRLVVTGAISLFQDDTTGQRMPLPFYVLGASQVVFGRNLLAGRLVSIVLGAGVFALTIAVARRLSGDWAGVLAGLLLATQGVVVGYYATAGPRAVTALIFMAAIWVFLNKGLPWRCALGMLVASLLFFTRTNMFPALPFFCVWGLLGARGYLERLVVAGVTVAPPAAFFLSDARNIKLFVHVPILNRFVEPLGYRSIFSLSAFRRATSTEQLMAFPQFARRYESWTLAAGGLGLAAVLLSAKRRVRVGWTRWGDTGVVAALFVWVLAWHFVIFRPNFRLVLAYFPDIAPLAAVLLGVGFTALWDRASQTPAARIVLSIALAGALTVSLVFIRHPLMSQPVPRPFHNDAIQVLDHAAGELRALVPLGERVFVFGRPITVYLAGLNAPLQQVMSPGGTLAPANSDPRLVARSGAWGMVELERWLGTEMGYAIICGRLLDGLETSRPEAVGRIRELVHDRFVKIGEVGEAAWLACDVYRRRS
jgi:4-amino-4-deoxy-L-arabinose transferase-like glycosyltransferase